MTKRKRLPLWVHYLLMMAPGFAWMFIFSLIPMVGIVMAFQNFYPNRGWFGSEWVGLENFSYLFSMVAFRQAVVNTLIIAVGKIVLNIVVPLTFALLLNEIKNVTFKKSVQTIVYLPHFLSWVILANVLRNIFGIDGVFNLLIGLFGGEPRVWLTEVHLYRGFMIGTDVWKEFGYNAVIYLAALTGISPQLYEAAAIDGASRWQATVHITIPSLIQTVILLTTLAMGNILNACFDQIFNTYTPVTYETGDIIDTFVYRLGIVQMNFSTGTAAGLFKSVISFILIVSAYVLAYKFADYTIF